MGRPEMAEKHKNPTTQVCGRRRLRLPDPGAFGGGWPGNLPTWSSGRPPPPWPARVQYW